MRVSKSFTDQAVRPIFAVVLFVSITIAIPAPLRAIGLTVNYGAVDASACSMNGIAGTNGTTNGNPGIVGSVNGTAEPLTGSVSCTGPNNFSVSGSATANYNLLEVQAVMNGSGILQLNASASDIVTLVSPDLAPGTPLTVTVPFFETGSYTYTGFDVTVNPIINSSLNGATLVDDDFGGGFACDNQVCSGSGNLDRNFNAAPLTLNVGLSYLFTFAFDVTLDNGLGTGVINFGDPSIPDFQVTDPNTGALVSDVTIEGQSGTDYPVNGNTGIVPEPSMRELVALGLLGIAVLARYRARYKA